MKNLLWSAVLRSVLLLLPVAACQRGTAPTTRAGATGFSVQGRLTSAVPGTVISLKSLANAPVVLDSALVDEKGRFELRGQVPDTALYRFAARTPGAPADSVRTLTLVIGNGSAQQIAGDLRRSAATYVVRGYAETDQLQELQVLIRQQERRVQGLERRLVAANSHPDTMQVVQRRYYQTKTLFRRGVRQFVRARPASLAAAYATAHLLDYSIDLAFIDSMRTRYEQLRPHSPYTKYIGAKMRLDASKVVRELGSEDFVLPGVDGRPVALSSLKGQPVLVYFWWPAQRQFRTEAKQVHQMCAEYAKQGLRLYSVCLEPERAAWQEIIAEDSLTGVLTWDPNGKASYARFPLRSIPASLLLDAQGRVIGQDLRGESLFESLIDLFD
ncbi:AhpC/TSA family protein [Hymenobacter busanensis]|uniref:AhpC/TSA family protein n=1 Tax=Hymenobacter busanensis TaxID=2607656 RepID=A0A7L4ZT64_9BACT|nr:TlpA disulfide reductase family protein [Hymenobacter busanensis]KAA9325849.1 AhpC/TSA family protein [Hymenobacter busanensis]QHJ06311.1 redoxin domain-containing protein [Hymenobacter busanensis]